MKKFNYDNIPEHMVGGLERYLLDGIPPGSFLVSVLRNDLKGAFANADHINSARIRDYVTFLYNQAPRDCWGNEERVRDWIAHRGLNGLTPADEGIAAAKAEGGK